MSTSAPLVAGTRNLQALVHAIADAARPASAITDATPAGEEREVEASGLAPATPPRKGQVQRPSTKLAAAAAEVSGMILDKKMSDERHALLGR